MSNKNTDSIIKVHFGEIAFLLSARSKGRLSDHFNLKLLYGSSRGRVKQAFDYPI